MGTNYYLQSEPCQTCGHVGERLHIGKSSGGWCFSLHVIPELGINSLDDWKREFCKPGRVIVNEYGDTVPPATMVATITERSWPHKRELDAAWYRTNHAEPGPNGLARHAIGCGCVGHGEGTWDYLDIEFS